ncbi:MAG: EVE domain-containing protein [Pelagibacteraceae bacterium]|jgi:predicted RNA-binding protein with PUA-like domain|nr:EVE domain-containing protein [Pelagibacteraceae bacterium]|tara:strand:+ start:5089 stop:5505 length:417 start_codon:yes stop_codon:yes gene_type:complete
MKYWLLKTEPQNWSWKDQLKSKNQIAEWNGVRNYQASKNLKAMKKNDLCFFYHSGKEKRIIGIVRIIKEYFRDKTDKANKFVSVMVRGEDELSKPITLEKIKNDKFFKELALVKQSRLSVMEINTKYWKKICKMSNMD